MSVHCPTHSRRYRPAIFGFVKRIVLAGMCFWSAGPFAAMATPPQVELTLAPKVENEVIQSLDVAMRIEAPKAAAGEAILESMLLTQPLPLPRYDGDAIGAQDELGRLPLKIEDSTTPSGGTRRWLAQRPTKGDVVVHFVAVPRQVSASTRPAPIFDLRAEAGGLNGAGLGFLPSPSIKGEADMRVHWDLSRAPKDWKGVWTYGEGDARKIGKISLLNFSFYAVGPVRSAPANGNNHVSLYWLSIPPFDTSALLARLGRLYARQSRFFHDPNRDYRVFIRAQPYATGSGTSFNQSFVFGWGAGKAPGQDELQNLLAHEMVHNWLSLDGPNSMWYVEGGAEYYGNVLAFRAGLLTPAQALDEMNARARQYYANPLQRLSLEKGEELTWDDGRAQRLPYDRGALFFARTDMLVREATKGRRGVDDVVQDLQRRVRAGETVGVDHWLEIVGRDLGTARASAELEAMLSGELLTLPKGIFKGCFTAEPRVYHAFEYDMDQRTLSKGRRIGGLKPGSPAAKAGLRNGDEVVEISDLDDAMALGKPVVVTIMRNGVQGEVSFVPRGDRVAGFAWTRVAGVPDQDCKL